jgi:TRAP transporter TAXI family solute receptor
MKWDRMAVKDFIGNNWPAITITVTATAIVVAAVVMLRNVPPDKIVIATGGQGGAYYKFGNRYREELERAGVKVEIRETKGSPDNLAQLHDPKSGVSAALIQGGTVGPDDAKDIETLGTVFYEPLWLFGKRGATGKGLGGLRGKSIAVGPDGSGTQKLVLELLQRHGIDGKVSKLLPLATGEGRDRLLAGTIDAAFMVASWDAPDIQRLLSEPNIELSGYPQADAYVALDPFLHKVVVPRGLRDLAADQPPADVMLVAPKASLVVRKDLHPAIEFLLLRAARQIHATPGVFQHAGEFPDDEAVGLPLSDAARRFYKQDLPFLYNYLPYWIADLIGKAVFLLIPIIGVLYPMMRFLPTVYDWTVRHRIRRLYGELRLLDDELKTAGGRDGVGRITAALERLEEQANGLRVPVAYANQLYDLRQHIGVVRGGLIRQSDKAAEAILSGRRGPEGAPAKSGTPVTAG